jgi:hypothetical protein
MSDDPIEVVATTAADAHNRLAELEEERDLAVSSGVADIDSYMRDLEAEIEMWHRLYVTIAVTEIAVFRAELTAPQLG